MSGARHFRVWLSIAVVSVAAGCGPKPLSTTPARPAQDLAVLLLDSDTGSVGGARVSNQLGSVDLAAERDAAVVTANGAPVLTKLSPAEVESIFGEALSALPPAPQSFTLFFRFESDELTEQSQALIPQVLAAVKQYPVQDVVVIGHTDTTGSQQVNYGLGLKRAMTMRNLLVRAGLGGATIQVMSMGELDLQVKTPDETPEPRNRRVEIAVR
jgi:outer membrane protein OmpA-like peptidoglycan-associated protein